MATLESSALDCSACGAPRPASLAAGLCLSCLARRFSVAPDTGTPAVSTDVRLPAGYELLDTLGRGGMGVVYLVYQRELSRYVALKQVALTWQNAPKARERFIREARAAARLSHPGIVPILEVGADDDPVWYTMAYMEGGDLSQLLATHAGKLPWREAVLLVAKIASALQHAHVSGVAHRDLKPSNILLDASGMPKLADFGLAWVTGHEGRHLTMTGEVLGTPAYLAPEVISGTSRESDARLSDIYSLGALLFHLVTGRPPFVADHVLQLLGSIVNEPAPSLSAVATHESPPWYVSEICTRCLAKKPEDRFHDAAELTSALDQALRDKPPARRIWRKPKRRWMTIAAMSCVVLVVGLAGAYLRFNEINSAKPAVPAAKPKGPLLAVMPFKHEGGGPTAVLLAGGLQDEIISALNRLTDLAVISAGSARSAGAKEEDPRVLRSTLGADALLVATVRQWQDTLRVSVQLLGTEDGSVKWTANYDRRETNLFNLQTDIAMDVAVQLNAQLAPDPGNLSRGTSSPDPEAQRLLLKARALTIDASASVEQLNEAEALLLRAVEIDPNFALAFARLSHLHTLKYHWGNDRTETRLAMAFGTAQSALRLSPQLPEAKLALGFYYLRGSKDFVTAKPYLESALAQAPTYVEALEAMAQIERRDGHFEEATSFYSRAMALDPLNPILAYNAADTFLRLRQYETAAEMLNQAMERMPGHVALQKLRGDLHLLWKGELGPMKEDIQNRDPALPTPALYLRDKITCLVFERQFNEALAVLQQSDVQQIEGQSVYLTREGYEAWLQFLAGQKQRAQELAVTAEKRVSRELQLRPNDPRVLLHAAEVHALLGDIDAAQRLGLRTITPGDLACADAFDRGFFQRSLAVILATVGRDDEAKRLLRLVLSEPNQTSVHYVRLHPVLDRLAAELF